VVVCVPSGITGVEQRAVEEATIAAARRAYIIEEPMAAAIGAGLPIHEPTGNMGRHRWWDDRGGGHLARRHRDVDEHPDRWHELDEAIIQHVKKEYSLLLGERTSERRSLAIASVFPMPEELVAEIKGRDLVSGLPKNITSAPRRSRRDRRAGERHHRRHQDHAGEPPELSADIMDRGIVLTGGGALLRGLDKRLRHETGMPVRIADARASRRASVRASAWRSSRCCSGSW
jgi:rod shape-determining protein MreB